MQFWHDNKRWPIGNLDPHVDGRRAPNYKNDMVFCGQLVIRGKVFGKFPEDEPGVYNNIVFDELFKTRFANDEDTKTYFDVNAHITNDQSIRGQIDFPVYAMEQMKDVLTENTNRKVPGTGPVFCYWATIFKCPHCDARYHMNAKTCSNTPGADNPGCSYLTQSKFAYTFKPADKSANSIRALFPYKVTIDFHNDMVWVEKEY